MSEPSIDMRPLGHGITRASIEHVAIGLMDCDRYLEANYTIPIVETFSPISNGLSNESRHIVLRDRIQPQVRDLTTRLDLISSKQLVHQTETDFAHASGCLATESFLDRTP